jgi:(S)-ureidoglycine aminohydrolase
MGHRREDGMLLTRAVVKKNEYALLPQDGLVKNNIPGFEGSTNSILSSPKLGAGFVDYLVSVEAAGQNTAGFGGGGIETFLYVLQGALTAWAGEEAFSLSEGGYLFCPPDRALTWKAASPCRFYLYKRRYRPLSSALPPVVSGQVQDIKPEPCGDLKDMGRINLLPSDPVFDISFHILLLPCGVRHDFIETHVQEHGAYILSGEGMYLLGQDWMPVHAGDYIFMAPYTPQGGYGVSPDVPFSYLYFKDCNRDEEL